uniref:BPTI/Kunitz inhibitor domain-containing protein n=1 Tax=Parascaris equorum TaxID=6256 RepID=A0A914S936_PAREQ
MTFQSLQEEALSAVVVMNFPSPSKKGRSKEKYKKGRNEFRPPKFITADGKQDESLETITYIEGILCRLPKSVGYECSSNRPTPAFYFDSTIQQCIKYIFLGCGGNPNRFTTKLQCEQGCQLMSKPLVPIF